MKTTGHKKRLSFGGIVAATYRAWGAVRARGLVQLAVNAHLVVFRGEQRFVIREEQDENLSRNTNAD
jgi:hypothetical protein